MDAKQNNANVGGDRSASIRSFHAPNIRAKRNGVHDECDSGNPKEHVGGPEFVVRAPGMNPSIEDFVARGIVFLERPGNDSDHDGIQDERNDSGDEAKNTNH